MYLRQVVANKNKAETREVHSILKKSDKKTRNLKRLSETEMEVMQTIWKMETPITVAQLLFVFKEGKNWKTSTLSTILSRLMEKGFLNKELKGKVNFYNPAITLQEYQKYETQSLLKGLYGGNVKNFVAALVDVNADEGIAQEDIEDIKRWFSDKADDKK